MVLILCFLIFQTSPINASEVDQSFFYNHFPQPKNSNIFKPLTQVRPYNWQTWYKDFFSNDEKGILLKVKNQIIEWNEKEKYVKQWNLESTGQIPLASEREKKTFIFRHFLKYGDYKLTQAAKESEEGSGIRKVAKMRETLRPSKSFTIAPKVKFKINARVLEGYLTAKLINPYLNNEIYYDRYGNLNVFASKTFDFLETSLIYEVKNNKWSFQINRAIFNNLKASLISKQPMSQLIFSSESDKMIQFYYNYIY